jgi:hypothetical protein
MMAGSDAFAIEPYLPAPQYLVDMGFRYPFKPLEQKIIYALPLARLVHNLIHRDKQGKIFA